MKAIEEVQSLSRTLAGRLGSDNGLVRLLRLKKYQLWYEHARIVRSQKRYLKGRVYRRKKVMSLMDRRLDPLITKDSEFLKNYRCSRAAFEDIVDLIKDNPVFVSTGRKRQAPVHHQLLVYLKFLGSQGNGASPRNLASFFGIGVGTTVLYMERVQKAILALEKETVIWPDKEERKVISKYIKDRYLFPNCVGLIDGTLLPLEFKPSKDHSFYFCRKSFYAINMLVVCDANRRVLYYHVGWPGGTHDNRVWRNTPLNKYKEEYFVADEYLLNDAFFFSRVGQLVFESTDVSAL